MIWSVSTLDRRSGTPIPLCTVKGSIGFSPGVEKVKGGLSVQIGGRGQPAAHRGGRGDQRGDQVRAAALALPALEVAVGGGGAALAGRELVGIHAEAHRAARLPPFGAGGGEDLTQTLRFG